MAYILNIETSAEACSVSLGQNDSCLIVKRAEGDWQHSRQITLLIKACMDKAALAFKDLDAVAISKGPGSYTGLRVAASAAKGICFARNIPLIAVDTLKIIAYPQVLEMGNDDLVIPLIDARRSEVYYNIYNKDFSPQIETTNLVLELNSFQNLKAQNLILTGNGALKAQEIISIDHQSYPSEASAEYMAPLSYEKFKVQDFENLAYFSPFYLKPPNITKSKKTLF